MLSVLFATASKASSTSASITSAAVSLGVLVYLLVRQRQVRVLQTRMVLPLVLIVLGLVNVSAAMKSRPLSSGQLAVLVALLAGDAIGLGAVRAVTVRLWRQGGVVYRQGTWLTVGLWVVGVAIHEGSLLAAHMDSSSLVLYMGATLGAQMVVLTSRAGRSGQLESEPRAA